MKNRNAPEPDNKAPDIELLWDYFFDYREYGLILMLYLPTISARIGLVIVYIAVNIKGKRKIYNAVSKAAIVNICM